ncbi:hypothetical protein C2845_PM13G01550 [Panicum miliaceum]|uniref:Major facilitator superfamily (MFS) profile domain-containing protein n=1 Tax=Panicum miliaceum TaxID=4540 RepID=A0A3L6RLW3_PANMI|nr:hypothetical protein C2845_PM13G01550 [Panicum miliaceum]
MAAVPQGPGSLDSTLSRAYATEACRKEYNHLGLSIPADKYPGIFSKKSIFGRFPYFLPSLSVSILSFVALISCFWLQVSSITVFNVLINDAVTQDVRGQANGIAVTIMSISKAIAPAVAGIIFSWAQKRQKASFLPRSTRVFVIINLYRPSLAPAFCFAFPLMPSDHLVFFMLNVVTVIGIVFTFRPFFVRSTINH